MKALQRVLNILRVIADPDSQSPVVLGHTEFRDHDSCQTYRCVLGWYNHIFRKDEPYPFSEAESKQQFGIDSKTYLKIFGTGSDATEDPRQDNFDENQTRREIRRRIKVVEKVLASVN